MVPEVAQTFWVAMQRGEFITDVDLLFQHHGILAGRLGAAQVAPSTSMLGVTRLAIPDLLIELEGTAVN